MAAAGAVAATCGVLLPGGASGASHTLPTLKIALTGTRGVAVSGSTVSGAVNVDVTFTGHGGGQFGLISLHPGVTMQQANHAVASHHGDLNALTPYATL